MRPASLYGIRAVVNADTYISIIDSCIDDSCNRRMAWKKIVAIAVLQCDSIEGSVGYIDECLIAR